MLEIKFTIDVSDKLVSTVKDLAILLNQSQIKIEPRQPEPKQPEPKQPEPKQPEPKQPEPKQPEPKQPEPKQPGSKQPEPKQPEPKQPEPKQPEPKQSKTNLTVEDVRALLRVKVNNDTNREKLKAKLESLGASNVTNLAKEHYDEFYKYMKELP